MGRMLNSKAPLPVVELPALPQRPVLPVAATRSLIFAGPAREPVQDRVEGHNPLRKLAFYATLGFLFLRMSAVSELLATYTGINFYLLYLFAPLSIFGMLFTGGIGRAFRHNSAKYWVAFFAWMVLATPFSTWRGDSMTLILEYGRLEITMLFVIGGLAMNWKEIRLIFYTVAFAALVNLASVRFLTKLDNGGRISMEASGNLGNSNDLGAHLLLVLPFLLFVVLDQTRNMFLRISLLPLIGYGLWVVLGTGSRGCLIAMGMMFLFALWQASPKQRVATIVAAILLAVIAPVLLPGNVLSRLSSLFGGSQMGATTEENMEAEQSSAARQYLLRQSIVYTMENPIFGVGPGQFPNYEGGRMAAEGKRGEWHVTHNFLTQVSSECGIPALIFMLLGVGSAFLLVNRTYREARKKGFSEIANACFCYQLGMVGYLCSVIFLAHAYHFYLPTMVGLAIAISLCGMQYMSTQNRSAIAGSPLLPFANR